LRALDRVLRVLGRRCRIASLARRPCLALTFQDAGDVARLLDGGLPGFADLAAWIAKHLRVHSAVLDGEIACVDGAGRPVFRDLLFRRRQCVFIAFDLLYLNGKDLRTLPLTDRKAALKKLLRRKRSGESIWPFYSPRPMNKE